jgi:hypothetical protein
MVWFWVIAFAIKGVVSSAAGERRSEGSNLGKPMIDWGRAFEFYVALSDERRSYQAVADEFGVSVRTVESHGGREGWGERLRAIKQKVAQDAVVLLEQTHVKRLTAWLRTTEATIGAFADQLIRGEVRLTPADLERMFRVYRQLGEELQLAAVGSAGAGTTTGPDRSPEHVAAVISALTETGAIEALGLRPVGDTTSPEDDDGYNRSVSHEAGGHGAGGSEFNPSAPNPTFVSPTPGREEHR